MYQPLELARFALSEFERGLEGLTDKEARTRIKKADDSEMNAISWTVGHIAGHWLVQAAYASQERLPSGLQRFGGATADPTPLSLNEAFNLLGQNCEHFAKYVVYGTRRSDQVVGMAFLGVIVLGLGLFLRRA